MRWTEVRSPSDRYDEERVVLGADGGVGECVRHLLASSGCGRFSEAARLVNPSRQRRKEVTNP